MKVYIVYATESYEKYIYPAVYKNKEDAEKQIEHLRSLNQISKKEYDSLSEDEKTFSWINGKYCHYNIYEFDLIE